MPTIAVMQGSRRTVIDPQAGWVSLRLAELWQYRELVLILAQRDLKVRYRHTVLGLLWAVLQPMALLLVFWLAFSRLATGSQAGAEPYPLFVLSGLLAWQLFAQTLGHAGNSIVEHERMISKTYFPRLALPLSTVLVGLVDSLVVFALLAALAIVYGVLPGPSALALPLPLAMALALALGIGLWISALGALYRDFRYAIPLLTQVLMLASPIAYPVSALPDRFQDLAWINPVAGIVGTLRWCCLPGHPLPPSWALGLGAGMIVVVLISGLFVFRRMERRFADIL